MQWPNTLPPSFFQGYYSVFHVADLFLGKRQGETIIKFRRVYVDKRSLTHYRSIHYHMRSVEQPDNCGPAAAKDFGWITLRRLLIGNWKGPWSFHSDYWNSLPASKNSKGHIWKQLFHLHCSAARSWRQLAEREELLLGWMGHFRKNSPNDLRIALYEKIKMESKDTWGRRGQNLNRDGKMNKNIKRWVIKGGWSGPLGPSCAGRKASCAGLSSKPGRNTNHAMISCSPILTFPSQCTIYVVV